MISVRLATPEDADTVIALLDDAARWVTAKGIRQWSVGQWERGKVAAAIDRRETFVATDDGVAVGTVNVSVSDEAIWPEGGDALYVHRLAVASGAHGRGIGAQLLRWAEGQARLRGRGLMRLDCSCDNAALRSYYAAHGYVFRDEQQIGEWCAARFEKAAPLSGIGHLPKVTARDIPRATAAQMAEADRRASEDLGIPLEVLMENAAHQIATATRYFLGGQIEDMDVVAMCGTGNNGGDALAALRHLADWGANVEAYVAAPRDRLRPLAQRQYDILAKLGVALHESTAVELRPFTHRLRRADIVLDGLLGYSAREAPRGEIARLIQAIYTGGKREQIVAVDIPSGLHPDTGDNMSGNPLGTVPASLTVTLALPKAGLLAESAARWTGEIVVADIGIPPQAYAGMDIDARRLYAPYDLVRIIP